MDLNIFIVLLFLLFSGGNSLTCYTCKSRTGSCVGEQVLCPSGNVCAIKTTSLCNSAANFTAKACVLPEACGGVSINYGIGRSKLSVRCCNTHLCNIQDVPDYTSNRPNGKKCYYCNENNCLNKLDCLGTEDHCITTIKTTEAFPKMYKGCASKSTCDTLPHINDRFNNHVCCKGNLCNTEENLHDCEKKQRYMKKTNLWDSEENLWDGEEDLWDSEEDL